MKKLKIVIPVLIAVFTLAFSAIWVGGWGAKNPTHPSLVKANLAPIIPIGDFFASTDGQWGYTISPEGKYMAWRAVDRLAEVLKFKTFPDGKTHTIRPAQGFRFFWGNADNALYLHQYEKRANKDGYCGA